MSSYPLLKRLDAAHESVLEPFLDYVSEKALELYPAQEEAILELLSGKNVILNTPTGSGKSLVATALHFSALARGKRSIYTCPIKALVNEKFLSLCRDFGPDQVGMITGDASVNSDAPIIVCTAEILANDALRQGADLNVEDVIMDEFHFYSDRERGVAWQIPLLILKKSRFLLMSATLGDTAFFEKALTDLTGRETTLVQSDQRPVPLEFRYQEVSLQKTILDLIAEKRSPIYLVNFTQRECAEEAQNLMSIDFCSKEEKQKISEALADFRFSSPYGKEIHKLLKHGLGIHHAGLLPKYRVLVEKLAQQGLLKVICGTDTLGVGVNVPIRTVLFTKLCKFDGQKTTLLSIRDFKQIAGRAGRKGFDDRGLVVAMAPEHVIENLRIEEKAKTDPKAKKAVKKKPPEKGYIPWDRATFDRLIQSQPEPLSSRFSISHGMLLNVLSRPSDGGEAMAEIIRACHEGPGVKKKLRRSAFELFRSLVERKIIEFVTPTSDRPTRLRVNVELQDDFSLHATLSLYLLDTLKLLSPGGPTYAVDVLSLVESILEDPDIILRRQLDRVKIEKIAELKAEGMDFDQRMEELEKLEYPKPNREFIYSTFNEFAQRHPWVGTENIRPKSIAREMWETYQGFADYIREYGLERSEGLLLRYLSEVYKTLLQTVPDALKNDELEDIHFFLKSTVKQIDSSLIDEWEKLRNNSNTSRETPKIRRDGATASLKAQERERTLTARNKIFEFVKILSSQAYRSAEAWLACDEWREKTLQDTMTPYYSDHQRIATSPEARAPKYLKLEQSLSIWKFAQVLVDPESHNDWVIEGELEWKADSTEFRLRRIGPIE